MKTLKQLLEVKYVSSADFVLSATGRKVHKRKKIADDDYDKEKDLDNDGDNDRQDQKLARESVVPAHMKGKQKPYVSSDGKGNYEVLGNTGQTKAEFSRKEHGKDAHSKAQAHLKSKYDEYMKEETKLDEKLNVGGGPVRTVTTATGGRIAVNSPEKKPMTKPLGKPEPRKSNQVTSAMDRLRARMKPPVKEETEAVDEAMRSGFTHQDAAEAKRRREETLKNNPKIAAEVERRRVAANPTMGALRGKPVQEEIEELDELSKDTLDSYRDKAYADQPSTRSDNPRKYDKRKQGRETAYDKMTGRRTTKEETMKEGRSDSVIQTTASDADENAKHIFNLRDHGIYAQQGAGASHHVLVPKEHEDKAREILAGHLKEAADPTPIAPSIGVHRIGVTVSDADHPAVTKRKELIQKFVRVTAHDKDSAVAIGKKHFAKKGWKVHDASHSGMVHEEALDEYSMDDVRKDAADHLKKSIDKQSDDRIAALKNPPKKKGFFARVGEKQINMVKGAYHGLTKEEVELEESKDKADKRFDLLARLGLVEKDELANLRLAMKTLSEDKQLSIKQRDLLLNVYESLITLVTGDDTMFSRMKIKVQEQMLDETKGDVPFDGPYTKTPDSVKDKSGAEHTPQSRARHLAKMAMKQMAKKAK